jgi:hypothetical protein
LVKGLGQIQVIKLYVVSFIMQSRLSELHHPTEIRSGEIMKKLLSTLFALAFALNCYAADVKISDLTEVTSPTTSTAVLPVVDAGATKKVTIDNILKRGSLTQAWDTELSALAGLTFADKSIIQLTGASTASVLTCTSANQLIGVNAANDALECKSTINVLIDNSAAQIKDSSDATKLIKIDPSAMTTGKTLTVQGYFDQSATLALKNTGLSADSKTITLDLACTDNCTITGPASTSTLAILGAQTFTGSQTFTTSILPVAATTTIGSSDAEWGGLYLGDGKIIYGQADQSNTITSSATGWTFAKPVTISDVTNDNYIKITNNSGGRAATASVNEIYPDANVWKLNSNGTETTIAHYIAGATTSAADSLAIPVTHTYVAKTTGADAEALTLADGIPGQILTITLAVDGGGDGTLTPTHKSGFGTIVFADAGDVATLMFVDATVGWILLGTAGVAAPPAITAP